MSGLTTIGDLPRLARRVLIYTGTRELRTPEGIEVCDRVEPLYACPASGASTLPALRRSNHPTPRGRSASSLERRRSPQKILPREDTQGGFGRLLSS